MKWLEKIKQDLHAGKLGWGLDKLPPDPPAEYELIRLPDRMFLAGRGGDWVSSITPYNPPTVITLDNGSADRLWQHGSGPGGFFISTAGIDATGALEYCDGVGGCQYRAFANASGLLNTPYEMEDKYLDIAIELGHGDLDWKYENFGRFYDTDDWLVDAMASSEYMDPVRLPENPDLAETLNKVQHGVLLATDHPEGAHLVAVREGMQVAPSLNQMLDETNKIELAYRLRWAP